MSINTLTLTGRLTSDPMSFATPDNKNYTRFCIASDIASKDKKETMFIYCIAYNGLAKYALYAHKGDFVCASGKIYFDSKKNVCLSVIQLDIYFSGKPTNETKEKPQAPFAKDVSEEEEDDLPF